MAQLMVNQVVMISVTKLKQHRSPSQEKKEPIDWNFKVNRVTPGFIQYDTSLTQFTTHFSKNSQTAISQNLKLKPKKKNLAQNKIQKQIKKILFL